MKTEAAHPSHNSVRYRSMEIKIGHYGRNITPTEAIKGGIKSPDIINERGTGSYGIKAREPSKKITSSLELWHITSMIAGRENLYRLLQTQYQRYRLIKRAKST